MSRARLLTLVVVLGLVVIGAVKGGPYVWLGIQYFRHARLAASREPGAMADWRSAFGNPDALLASYARTDDNATARHLVALEKPLGINVDSPSPAAMDGALSAYVSAETRTPSGDPPDAPPTDVRSYLDSHRPEIAALVDLLNTADVPAWQCDMSSIVPKSSVNFAAIRLLNTVLAADALDEASQGRWQKADRAMRAAWQVMRSARRQPLMIDELMGMSIVSTDAAVLRRLAVDVDVWRPRLAEYDYPASFARAVEAETARRVRAHGDGSMTSLAWRADYLDGMRADVSWMGARAFTDDPIVGTADLEPLPSAAPATAIAAMQRPGLDRAWRQARGVMLSLELTDRVLEARQATARAGRWPAALPDVASTQVPGARWVYAVSDNGAISIALSPTLPTFWQSLRFDVRR